MKDSMTERADFEAEFSAPPYEFRMERWGDRAAWAGAYKSYNTQCAWDGYQAGRRAAAQIGRSQHGEKP